MAGSPFTTPKTYTPQIESVAVPIASCGDGAFVTDTTTTEAGRVVVLTTPHGEDFPLQPAEAIDLARAVLDRVAFVVSERVFAKHDEIAAGGAL